MKLDLNKFNPCEEGLAYYETKDSFEQAWNDCENPDWLFWVAQELCVDGKLFTIVQWLSLNMLRDLVNTERGMEAEDEADAVDLVWDGVSEIDDENYEAIRDSVKTREFINRSIFWQSTIAYKCAFIAYHAIVISGRKCSNDYFERTAVISACAGDNDDVRDIYYSELKKIEILLSDICRNVLTDAVMEKVRELN